MSTTENKTFWHGEGGKGKGVVSIAGEKYFPGDEVPIDKVDPKSAKKWKEDGSISSAAMPVKKNASDTAGQARIKELEGDVAKLKNAKNAKGGKCKDCPKKDKRITEIEADLKTLGGRADNGDENLNVAIERADILDADVKEKAALIEKQAARITELEAQIEELTKPGGGGQ